jgi:hypothetical protein
LRGRSTHMQVQTISTLKEVEAGRATGYVAERMGSSSAPFRPLRRSRRQPYPGNPHTLRFAPALTRRSPATRSLSRRRSRKCRGSFRTPAENEIGALCEELVKLTRPKPRFGQPPSLFSISITDFSALSPRGNTQPKPGASTPETSECTESCFAYSVRPDNENIRLNLAYSKQPSRRGR